MPPEWEEDFWHESSANAPFEQAKSNKSQGGPTLRPPLYNAEDYTAALKQLFNSGHHFHHHLPNISPTSVLIEHSSNGPLPGKGLAEMHNNAGSSSGNTPEMSMKKFLNGSELLFKLEADLRHAYPTFVQEFVSGQCEGVGCILEALKTIQHALDDCSGLREQRKLILDEQKCLQCVKLSLRNIEAVSKLACYPGGLYPLAAAMISTVTATRIIALEILTCISSEGGAEGHYKVSEAISTLRLRMGEPIRCKLLVGAISSAPPGTFQAKGIKFLTAWVASAPSPKHKVHIQCELEEAGFNAAALRKGADLGGARESREVQSELDEWDRVAIDVDTLTRQNCQLRNSVATLQQELATLKDKLKRMDVPQKSDESRKRSSRPKRSEQEMVTTPVDSEEEAEQIHQILEDLNNIVNSEMHIQQSKQKKEKEIVPVHLVKSPPKKGPGNPSPLMPRPWPGSSASDDDDSDIVEMLERDANDHSAENKKPNVRRVVEQLENMEKSAPKFYPKNHQKLQNFPVSMPKSHSVSPTEPKPDYTLPNFHKQNHMASKFANFKSSKLYSSSPDNSNASSKNNFSSGGYNDGYDKAGGSGHSGQSQGQSTRYNFVPRFSPNLDVMPKKKAPTPTGLRRSESLHASLASIEIISGSDRMFAEQASGKQGKSPTGVYPAADKWKSMENLDGRDDNFTLRWRYPQPQIKPQDPINLSPSTPSPKSSSKTAKLAAKNMLSAQSQKQAAGELCADYRQNRFTKNSKTGGVGNAVSSMNIFSRYTKKSSSSSDKHHQQQQQQSGNHNNLDFSHQKDKENMKMFSLPPILMSPIDIANHRISDLPSGLY